MDQELYRAFFGTLSNSSCLSILRLLKLQPRSVSELAAELGFEQSRVSHAVARLFEAGFADCRWQGNRKIYALNGRVVPILDSIDRFLQDQRRANLPSPVQDRQQWNTPLWMNASPSPEA